MEQNKLYMGEQIVVEKDVLGTPIQENDIVVYTKRNRGHQTLAFGIIVDPKSKFGTKTRISAIGIDSDSAKAGIFKVHMNMATVGAPVTHLLANQIWVVQNPEALPSGVREALVNVKNQREIQIQKREEERQANLLLTPQQRYERNLQNVMASKVPLSEEEFLEDILGA